MPTSNDARLSSATSVLLFRASGEGSCDYRICYGELDVRQAYIDLVIGDESTANHTAEVEQFMTTFHDEDEWGCDCLEVPLYCANVTIWRIPAGVIARSESARTHPYCHQCGGPAPSVGGCMWHQCPIKNAAPQGTFGDRLVQAWVDSGDASRVDKARNIPADAQAIHGKAIAFPIKVCRDDEDDPTIEWYEDANGERVDPYTVMLALNAAYGTPSRVTNTQSGAPQQPEAVYVWWSDLDQQWRIRKWDMQSFVEGTKYVREDLRSSTAQQPKLRRWTMWVTGNAMNPKEDENGAYVLYSDLSSASAGWERMGEVADILGNSPAFEWKGDTLFVYLRRCVGGKIENVEWFQLALPPLPRVPDRSVR